MDSVPRFLHVFDGDMPQHTQPEVIEEANNCRRVGPWRSRERLVSDYAQSVRVGLVFVGDRSGAKEVGCRPQG